MVASNALFTYGPDNVSTLLTTTQGHYLQNNLEDNVFQNTPFLKAMYGKAKKIAGGSSILIPLLIDENSTGTWYSGYDQLDTTPQVGMTLAQAKWKNFAVSVSISGDEERMNSGPEAVVKLLDGKNRQAELTISKQITSAFFAATTASKKMECITTMIDATSNIQDINSTTNSWWQSTVTTGGSFAAQGLSDMRTTHSALSLLTPEMEPDMYVTTNTIYDYYEGSLTPMTRYSPGGTMEGAPVGLKFKTATVMYDAQCTSGVMYIFPSQCFFLCINTSGDHKKTEFVKPSNQDARTMQIILMTQFVTNARRKGGKITTISA